MSEDFNSNSVDYFDCLQCKPINTCCQKKKTTCWEKKKQFTSIE